jgi:predicted GNAT superfamily acetyltransferase
MTAGPKGAALVTLRSFAAGDDYAQCIELQRETWGHDFTEVVPASMLMITQKVGGVAAGAFDPGGRLLGFIYGLSGIRHGRPAHWSHMLAVREGAQGVGLGTRLKLFQRELLLEIGIDVVYWTYDPLVARNAHLNINRLGALPTEYVPSMYGGDTRSELHSGLGTDRFIVEWHLRDPRVDEAIADRLVPDPRSLASDVPVVNEDWMRRSAEIPPGGAPERPAVRIEVPSDIMAVKAESTDRASQWRDVTRRAFLAHLAAGYRVRGFAREPKTDRCFYLLAR